MGLTQGLLATHESDASPVEPRGTTFGLSISQRLRDARCEHDRWHSFSEPVFVPRGAHANDCVTARWPVLVQMPLKASACTSGQKENSANARSGPWH